MRTYGYRSPVVRGEMPPVLRMGRFGVAILSGKHLSQKRNFVSRVLIFSDRSAQDKGFGECDDLRDTVDGR